LSCCLLFVSFRLPVGWIVRSWSIRSQGCTSRTPWHATAAAPLSVGVGERVAKAAGAKRVEADPRPLEVGRRQRARLMPARCHTTHNPGQGALVLCHRVVEQSNGGLD